MERDTGLVPSDSSPIDAMCEVTGKKKSLVNFSRVQKNCFSQVADHTV